MAVDIYIRNSTDPTFEEGRNEIAEPIDQFLQQIEMVLLTPKASVMGLPDFGGSLDTYLWEFNVSDNEIENEVYRQISTYCTLAKNFDYSVNVRINPGQLYDSAIVDISINGITVLGLQIK